MPALALIPLCALTVIALPSPASEIHTSKKPAATTTKLKESASKIKEDAEFGLFATVSPSKATGKAIFYGKGLDPSTGWD